MNIFFLSGLPRTGSHLLSSILSQNKQINSGGISGLYGLANNCRFYMNSYTGHMELSLSGKESYEFKKNIIRSLARSYYKNNSINVVDKHRLWTTKSGLETAKMISDNPKIIVMERDIEEVVKSLVVGYIEEGFSQPEAENISLNLDSISSNPLLSPMAGLINAKINKNKENFLFIDYNDMVKNIDKTLNTIYTFLEIKKYDHETEKITMVNYEIGEKMPKSFLNVRNKIEKRKNNLELSETAMAKVSYLKMINSLCNKNNFDDREKNILESFYENNFSWENL